MAKLSTRLSFNRREQSVVVATFQEVVQKKNLFAVYAFTIDRNDSPQFLSVVEIPL